MKITVWTLASDDDNGTQAAVFATEHEAQTAYFAAVFTEEGPTQRAAKKALDAGDYDELHEIGQDYTEGSLDTYNIDSNEIQTEEATAQCVPAEELAEERANLSPEERAKLDELGTNFDTEHEALTAAIEMLNRIAQGKSYDSKTYYAALEAMRATQETAQERTTRENIEAVSEMPDPIDEDYRNRAREQYGREGEIEIDEGATVSHGSDPGAYVAAWVWVQDERTDEEEE